MRRFTIALSTMLTLLYAGKNFAEDTPVAVGPAFQLNAAHLLQTSTLIARVKIESYAAPTVLSVVPNKIYKGKGDIKAGKAGWEEGKGYSVDIAPNDWKKIWAASNPPYDPIGKETLIILGSTGQLEAMGEMKGDTAKLVCARAQEKCEVTPSPEVHLTQLK